jgi:hypothetical protein
MLSRKSTGVILAAILAVPVIHFALRRPVAPADPSPAPLQGPPSASPAPPAGAKSPFATAEEAMRHVRMRILANDVPDGAVDPYTATFLRHYKTIDGATTPYYLAYEPGRELALAEGFLAHGLVREALTHFLYLSTFETGTPEGAAASRRIENGLNAGILARFPAGTPYYKDTQGRLHVPAQSGASSGPEQHFAKGDVGAALDRLHEPAVGPYVAFCL